MSHTLLVTSLVIFLTVAVYGLSHRSDLSVPAGPIATPAVSQTPTIAPSLSHSPKSKPSLPPTVTKSPSGVYVYPGAELVSAGVYTSTDDPKKITDWYKEKIKQQGLPVTSFVQTTTNGNVENKLSAASGSSRIDVLITKKNSQTNTTITITLP